MLRVEDEILQLRSALSELDHQISSEQQRGLELKANRNGMKAGSTFTRRHPQSWNLRMSGHCTTLPRRTNAGGSPSRNRLRSSSVS